MSQGEEAVLPIHISLYHCPDAKIPSPKVSFTAALRPHAPKDDPRGTAKSFIKSLEEGYNAFASALQSTAISEESFFATMREYVSTLGALVDGAGGPAPGVDAALATVEAQKPTDENPASAPTEGPPQNGEVDGADPVAPKLVSSSAIKGDSPLRYASLFAWNQVLFACTPVKRSDAVFELASVLVASAVWALRRCASLCESTPTGVPSAASAQAYRLLRQAAGLLNYVAVNVVPLFRGEDAGPDLSPDALKGMAACLLADAQGITVLRAIQKGNQPSLIASLAVGTRSLYDEAAKALSGMPGSQGSKLAAYCSYKMVRSECLPSLRSLKVFLL